MLFVQYYLDCLSQASYLIGDQTTGRAVVVDPRRDVDEYVADANADGLHIDYVIETHLHADFLSGHLELAGATGAEIVYGEAADVDFEHRSVSDGEQIDLGEVTLEFRATPGHTPESISVVVYDRHGVAAPYGVLTGDTLFIGDVGRPDLVAARGQSPEDMARELHRSLHKQLLTLPDETRVFPAHGAGSACGKSISTATESTIGEQRQTNYALRLATVDDFIQAVTEGQPPRPDYFERVAELNREVHELLHDSPIAQISLDEVVAWQNLGALIIDVRSPEEFARGHLRESLNVGLEGRFAEYAADIVDGDAPLVIAGDPAHVREARTRLARVGLDNVLGVLADPEVELSRRPDLVAVASRLTAQQVRDALDEISDLLVLDVRSKGERATGYIEGSVNVPLVQLPGRLRQLNADAPVVTYCAGGYRSSIAASFLRLRGWHDVSDLIGGYQAWAAA